MAGSGSWLVLLQRETARGKRQEHRALEGGSNQSQLPDKGSGRVWGSRGEGLRVTNPRVAGGEEESW